METGGVLDREQQIGRLHHDPHPLGDRQAELRADLGDVHSPIVLGTDRSTHAGESTSLAARTS